MTPHVSQPLLRAQSDGRLAALAAEGHDRAFEAIVERYRKPLARYLRRLLSEPLAEDVLQATFVRAWQALGSGTQVRELRPWLYRIAHNQAINALRAAGPGVSELPEALAAPAAAVAPDLAAERGEQLRSALRGIGDLPDRQRAALMAVAVEDRPHADVAAELGLSDGGLRQLLLRARTTLRAAATALTPYPLVSWLSAGSDVGAARMAEVATGAGGIGVAVKAGAAVLAAGAVVAGTPALRDDHAPSRATSVRTELTSPSADDHGGREVETSDDRGGRGGSDDRSASSGRGSGDDRSGSESSGRGSGDDHSGSSGRGSGDDRSGSTRPRSGDDSGPSPSSGPGSGDDSSAASGSGSDDSVSSGPGPSGSTVTRSEGGDDRSGSSGERGDHRLRPSGSGSSGSDGGSGSDD